MQIPAFSLPSNPKVKVTLREATVADALDFCDADPGMEEHLTTIFLNRVQVVDATADNMIADSVKWTADDRRLALYWYWIHTTEDPSIKLKYDCGHCEKQHSLYYDMRKLGEGYKSIAGKSEREFVFNGEPVIVRPLIGTDMETLEMMHRSITPDMPKSDARKAQSKMRLVALIRSLWFSSTGIDEDRIDANEKKLLAMTISELKALAEIVAEKMAEMEHGLETVLDVDDGAIYLTVHVKCDETEGETLLRVPFQSFVNIPVV